MRKILINTILIGFIAVQFSFAQQEITGTVIDESGLPLPGANVIIQGTNTGVATDFDGNYSINASQGDVLEFSFIGYANQSVTVGEDRSYNVTLSADTSLDEVVLTVLGTEKKKDEDLSSTTTVEVGQVQRAGESGVLQGLSGKTSGVNITRNSGDPGAGAYIQIRGQNTILGDNSPLIVLDGALISNASYGGGTAGVVQQSRLNDINPDDIESISVIKGASAAAIYGTGAANGVIVIKTKAGAKGSGAKGWSINVKQGVAVDQINIEWEKQGIFGQGLYDRYSATSGFSYGDKIANRSGGADVQDTTGQKFVADDGTVYGVIASGTSTNPSGGKNSKEVFNQSNRDAVFRNGLTLDTNIGVNYNSENSQTYMSFSRWDQQGIINGNSDYKRNTIKLNNTTKLNDWLTVKLASTFININSNRIQTGSNLAGLYLGYLRNAPDFDIRDYKGTNHSATGILTPNSHRSYRRYLGTYRRFNNSTGSFSYLSPIYNNPLWTINEQKDLNDVTRFIASPEAMFKITDNLNLTTRYSIDYFQDNRQRLQPAGSSSTGVNGFYDEDRYSVSKEQINVFINGNQDFSEDIKFNYTLGYQSLQDSYRRLSAGETVFTNPDQEYLNLGNTTNENLGASSYYELTRNSGGYAILDFDLFDNLLVQLTGRAETLSTLPGRGLIFYPSASAGYKLTDLIGAPDIVSFAKVRGSWGQVGVGPNAYATSTVYGTGGVFSSWGDGFGAPLYGNPFTRSSLRGNPDLKEERITEIEAGFDSRFLNDKISLSFTYYNRETRDGILNLPVPTSTGFSTEYKNATLIVNSGFEIDLGGTILHTNDMNFNANLSFTRNVNEVKDLAGSSYYGLDGFTSTSSGVEEGYAFGALRTGVYATKDDGSYELNSLGFPTAAAEKKIIGDPNPDFRAGLGLNFSYKKFSFTSLIETSQGNDGWNGTRGVLRYFGIHPDTAIESVNDTGKDIVNAFGQTIPAGETFRGYVEDFGGGPVAVDHAWWRSNGGGFGDVGEIFIEDASWTKLREVTLGYDFGDVLKSAGIQNLSVSVAGRNLITLTNIKGYDPENNLTGASRGRGLEYFSNPGTMSFLGTVNLSF